VCFIAVAKPQALRFRQSAASSALSWFLWLLANGDDYSCEHGDHDDGIAIDIGNYEDYRCWI